ncbi:uncharacterized protein HD556DRAFT_1243241 [Suillus plorans]|uniref:Uncharacterized protein n=1 Tax=Suillus plorans TaxID=116603 RepID=A0A9P7AHW3_9AGAM|nr:uncharacterized protein HD556DRAFT_1243241 [Suillus plorans]KAG1789894.1 hypothetical protein HD556DRAFT_1243241 [Suillus plorans]
MDVDPPCYNRHVAGGLYDEVVKQLMALPKGVSLGDATYKNDFVRDMKVHTGNFGYRCKENGAEYETVLVGEVMPRAYGTKLNAMGNHYVGTADTPNVIDDRARVKGVFALGKPTQATEMMYVAFENQIATLDDVIQSNIKELKRKNKDMNIKEWTANAGTETSSAPEFIMISTEQLYAVPKSTQQAMQGKRARITKRALNSGGDSADGKATGSSSSTDAGLKDNAKEDSITTNDFYEPTALPDYGGELFQHVNAKLQQLDIRNVENKLIPPQNWYGELKRGTLVMIRATLHAFNWKERRVYQLNAHTIRILDESKLEMEPLGTQPSRGDLGVSQSVSRASNAMAGVQLGKRVREEDSEE